MVKNVLAKVQDKVRACDTEKESRAELTAAVVMNRASNLESTVYNRVNRAEQNVDEIVIGQFEKHLNWLQHLIDLVSQFSLHLWVGAFVLTVTILCVTKEES